MPGDGPEAFDILGLGMSVLDSLLLLDDFPAEPGVTEVRESALMGGGPVPTALCAAARLGARAAIIDRVGGDWAGEVIHQDYERFGVATDYLRHEVGAASTLATALVRRRDGERHIVFRAGNATALGFDELPTEALRQCGALHLNGRHWPACLEAARIVREAGGVVSFDGGAHRYDPKFLELLPLVDVLVVARDFAERLAGSGEIDRQLESLAQYGATIAGLTDGPRGSWFLAVDGDRFHQPALPAGPVVDTTGCGDVFHGAFLQSRARGEDWRSCARFAAAAAAHNATALGGRGRLPRRADI